MARSTAVGKVVLAASAGYGVATMALAQSPWLPLALGAGLLIGACDAMATTIRQAAVQLETPDTMRGRVSAIYQMASRGGPRSATSTSAGSPASSVRSPRCRGAASYSSCTHAYITCAIAGSAGTRSRSGQNRVISS
jgi:hypothetical protein